MPAQQSELDQRPPAPSPAEVERQFLDAERRARRYWYEDGLGELAVGSVFVLVGLYFVAQHLTTGRLGRPGAILMNLLFPLIVVAGAIGVRRVIAGMKERLVYPRAGYAAYPQARRLPRWVTGMIAGAIAGLVAVLARSAPGIDAWIPALQGFVVAFFLWWLGRFSGLPRFNLLALVSGLVGVAVSLLNAPSSISGALYFGSIGAALMVSGWTAFRRFFRQPGRVEER